jgi:acyl-coenzyme A thioesterase PaaI-like protein
VDDSYFFPSDEGADGGRYRSGPATVGPWNQRFQHGGPPNALAVAVAERVLRERTGRDDLVALRVAADFVGPVPVGDLEARAEVLRAARTAALVAVTLCSGGRDCLLVRVWFVRVADTSAVAAQTVAPPPRPDTSSGLDISFGYGASIDWRFLHGRMGQYGPAAAWARPTFDLLPGRPARGLSLVTLIADSGNGISAELDWTTWTFLNVDLDIHLARPVEGDWVLLDAATQIGPAGSALARSTLSDSAGLLGSGMQTLLIASARPAAADSAG